MFNVIRIYIAPINKKNGQGEILTLEVTILTEIMIENMSTGYYGKTILHDINLSITQSGIYVVLGKNGVGKTTFFRTITGILKLYTGTLTIDGLDPYSNRETREKCVYLSHQTAAPVTMKVSAIIDMFAELMDANRIEKENTIRQLNLNELMGKSYVSLSQGQKKRVSIAKCLMKEREIYLFDEPTSNLDPTIAGDVRKTILNIAKNKIIFYSSQNLYEAREIGKNVIVIDNGKILYSGDMDSIQKGKYIIGIRSPDVPKVFPEAKLEGKYYLLELNSPDDVSDVIQKLAAANVKVREIREMSNPLEDILK